MICMRSHQLPNGRTWSTLSDGPDCSYVAVPIDEIVGMSSIEIGETVLGLINEAKATRLLNWLHGYNILLPSGGTSTNPNNKYINLCIALGIDSETLQGKAVLFHMQYFKELEELKSLDEELQRAYDEVSQMLDGAHNYLRNKKSKLSSGQLRAGKVILEMRNGCELCGLLQGKHTGNCMNSQTMIR
jgi:hypothetical protein